MASLMFLVTPCLIQPQVNNSKNQKDSSTINKAKPSQKPILKDKQCHFNTTQVPQTPSSPTRPREQTTTEQSTLPHYRSNKIYIQKAKHNHVIFYSS